MNGGKKVYLPDGRIITIPDNLSDEHKNLLVRGILNEFPELRDLGRFLEEEEGLGRPPQGQKYDRAAIDIRRSLYGLPGVPVPGSATDPLKNLPVTEAHEVERGATGTSSSPEDQQNIAQSMKGNINFSATHFAILRGIIVSRSLLLSVDFPRAIKMASAARTVSASIKSRY